MSMKLFEMKHERHLAIEKAEALVIAAERGNRPLSKDEQSVFDAHMSEATRLTEAIAPIERQSTLRAYVGANGIGSLIGGGAGGPFARPEANITIAAETMKPEYMGALHAFIQTGGKAHGGELTAGADGVGGYHVPGSERYTRQRLANGSFIGMSAAMYEGFNGGSNAAGGYAVSVPTDPQIVPLALPDLGIFDASLVVPTATDIKIPQQTSRGTSTIKAESNGTIATFGGSDPALGQIELTSYMAGALRLVSWELLQDVNSFQQFVIDDLLQGQRVFEGSLLATGTGTGQAQGVFGNTGTGTGAPYALTGASTDGLALLNSLFDVTATLKGSYQANASWIMSRATGLAIKRAQMQVNLFAPVATIDPDGTERILGRPVYYDVNAPALPTSATSGVVPILFGDFKAGYVIGVRGGAGISVKILDQPWAAQGQMGVLAYRRLDARVRRSEAIQAITFSHS